MQRGRVKVFGDSLALSMIWQFFSKLPNVVSQTLRKKLDVNCVNDDLKKIAPS